MPSVLEIDSVADRISQLLLDFPAPRRPLHFYFEVGQLLRSLPQERFSNQLGRLASELQSRGIDGFKIANLRRASKFAELTRRDVDKLASRDISWRLAAQVTDNKLVAEERRRLIRELLNSDKTPGELTDQIASRLGRAPEASGRRIFTSCKRIERDVRFLISVLHARKATTALRISVRDTLESIASQLKRHLDHSDVTSLP